MMQLLISQVRTWLRGQPRDVKVGVVQQYVLPECDLDDLRALHALVGHEIAQRQGQIIDQAVNTYGR